MLRNAHTPVSVPSASPAVKKAHLALDIFEGRKKPSLRDSCVIAGAGETLTRKLRREQMGIKPKPPRDDPIAEALKVLRRATLEQRIEAACDLGTETLWAALEALDNGNTADCTVSHPNGSLL